MVLLSSSVEDTRRQGQLLGRLLEPGDFVGLLGDLGAGKTEFVRGLVTGMGVDALEVTSPSFALVNSYKARWLVHHVDLYRLTGEDELYSIGYDELCSGQAVVVVEWMDRIPRAAPPQRLEISFVPEANRRRLSPLAIGPRATRLLEAWTNALALDVKL